MFKSKAIIQIIMLYSIKIIFSLQLITISHIKTKKPHKNTGSNIICILPSSLKEWKTLCRHYILFHLFLYGAKQLQKQMQSSGGSPLISCYPYSYSFVSRFIAGPLALKISLLCAQQNAFLLIVENHTLLKASCCSENLRVKGRCSCNSCKTAVVTQRKPLF